MGNFIRKVILFLILWSVVLSAHTISLQNSSTIGGFIENKGQLTDQYGKVDPEVLYLFESRGVILQLKRNSFSYEARQADTATKTIHSHRIDISLPGSNPSPDISATEAYGDYINFYLQHCSESGVLFVKHYKKITYSEIYPGIDLVFHEKTLENGERIFKYDFIVRKGGNFNDIKLEYKGASGKLVVENNKLKIPTSIITMEEEIPESWQFGESGHKIKSINAFYQLNGNIVSFKTEGIENELVIDPTLTRVWASYYGGTDADEIRGVDYDSSCNYYFCGSSNSSSNIATTGAFQSAWSGGLYDGILMKFDSSGNRLWATYYGGIYEDWFHDIKVYNSGYIYVTGHFRSPGMATSGVQQTTPGGQYDFVLTKFNNNGIRIWATYFGGTGMEMYANLAGDANENIFVTGSTSSTGLATSGTFQTTYGGGPYDALLVKFNSSGNRVWSTYYGGNNDESASCVNLDQSGNIYITGDTRSTNGIASTGSYNGGFNDGFVAKLSSSGQRVWGRYYGGADNDVVSGIETDPFGNIYITGLTQSTNNIATTGTSQTSYGGGSYDAFVMRLDSSGIKKWGSYLGGLGNDESTGMFMKFPYTGIYFQGRTNSATNIATSTGFQQTFGGGSYDYFLVKFDTLGTKCYGTYYGGPGLDQPEGGIVIDRMNRIIGVGRSQSISGIASPGAFQTTHNGIQDGMIVIFKENQTLSFTNPANQSVCINQPATFTVSSTSGYVFQWFKNGSKINGANDSTLVINSVKISDTGLYSCYIYQPCYGEMTASARLSVFHSASEHTVNDTFQCLPGNYFVFRYNGKKTGTTVKWHFGDGTFLSGDTATHQYMYPGIYFYSIVVKDTLNNCYDSITKKVFVNDEPFDIQQNTSPGIITDSLVAYYPFDGNTNDYSGRNHHANNYGSVSDTGTCGFSRKFNGSTQYAEVAYHPDFEPRNNPMTYACWFKADNRGTDRIFLHWYKCGANPACASGDMAAVTLKLDLNNNLIFSVRDDAMQTKTLTGTVKLTDNKWHFAAGVFDPVKDSIWLFWDNCHISSSYSLGSLTAGSIQVPLEIGRAYITGWGSPASYLYGNLDEIRIYKKSLTATDLQYIYHACRPLDVEVPRMTVCPGDTGIIHVVNPQEGIDYRLFDLTNGIYTGTTVNGSCKNLVVLKTNALQDTTSFRIRAINPVTGCEIFLDTVITFYIRIVEAEISVSDTMLCRDGNLFTFSSLTDTTLGRLSYLWQTGDGFTSLSDSFSHHYNFPGDYKMHYLVTDMASGCKDSIIKNIHVLSSPFNLNENVSSMIPTDSLVAYYPFDINANDYSGKNHHATAGTWNLSSAECSSGSAGFNGSTLYAEASYHRDFEPRNSAMTLSCWYKTSTKNKTMVLVSWYRCGTNPVCHYGQDGAAYYLLIRNNNLVFLYRDDAYVKDSIIYTVNIIDNKWHFISGIFDPVADSAYLFFDNCVVSKPYSLGTMSSGGWNVPFVMAREFITGWSTPGNYFNGILDEVRLYRRTLTSREVQALYHSCRKLHVSVSDTAFCGSNIATVNLYNPQAGVNYSLYDITHNKLIATQPGTCKDSLVFSTGLISSPSDFNIRAGESPSICETILDTVLSVNIGGILKTGFSVNDSVQCLKSNNFIFQNTTDTSYGKVTYNWKFGDASVSTLKNPVHHYNSAGTFKVKLISRSTNGCSDSIEKTLYVYPDPKAGFQVPDTTQCAKMNLFLFNNTSDTNNFLVNYEWNFGDGNYSTSKNTSHHYSSPGTYSAWLKITDINGCVDSSSGNILVFNSPSASFTFRLDTCTGLFTFTNQSAYSDKYLWDFGDGLNDTSKNTTHLYSILRSYNVRLFSSLKGECPDTFTLAVSYFYKNPYDLLGTNISICPGEEIVLTSVTAKSYLWSTGANTRSIRLKPTTNTWYFLTVKDSMNCKVKDSVRVMLKPKAWAQFNVNDYSQCIENNLFKFILNADTNQISQIYWDFGDGNTSNLFNPEHVYGTVGTHPVKLIIISTNGCTDTSVKSMMTTPKSIAGFDYSMDSCSSKVQFHNNSLFADKYYWFFGDTKSDTTAHPLHEYQLSGKYEVVLYTEYERNCKDTFRLEINVIGHDKLLYIPNVFSPNGDGINDSFIVFISDRQCLGKLTLMIFDRWGEELYSTSGSELSWDGKYRGETVPVGVYIYMLQGNIIRKVGTVSVLR